MIEQELTRRLTEARVFDDGGVPRHARGVIPSEPGLSFMGLPFQYSVTSQTIPGMGRDAAYLAKKIAARAANGSRAEVDAAVAG